MSAFLFCRLLFTIALVVPEIGEDASDARQSEHVN